MSDFDPQTGHIIAQLSQEVCNALQGDNNITANAQNDVSQNLLNFILEYIVIYLPFLIHFF